MLTSWRRETGSWKLTFALPLAVLLALTLPHLDQGDWRGDSGWYTALGLTGWRSGQLLSLHAGTQPYFNKPPLGLWIHGLFVHLLGVHISVARLPTILAASVCVLATTGIAARLAGRSAGACAGVVLATSIEFFRRTREVSLDMWHLAFIMLAAWGLIAMVSRQREGSGERRPLWIALAVGVPVGMALLVKPLMALAAFPILGLWLLLSGRCDVKWRTMQGLGLAGITALAVALPWHLWMWHAHAAEFTSQYFGAEVGRRAAGESVGGQRGQAWWFYLRQIVTAYWPWLPAVGAGCWVWARGRGDSGQRGALAFGIIWAGAWLVLLTWFPDRRDRYAVLIYPGLAIVSGTWLAALSAWWLRIAWRGARRWLMPVAGVGGIAFALAPVQVQSGPDRQWIEFHQWMESRRAEAGQWPTLYDASFSGAPAARVMLLTGSWPIATSNRRGELVQVPPDGSVIAYHRRGGRQPGPNETIEFVSGDLTLTRLLGTWSPVEVPDPGE